MEQNQKILMCAPDFYEVDYVINPWMEGNLGKTSMRQAHAQWSNLRDTLSKHVELAFQPPEPGVPDLVFTANAGMVLGGTAIVSRFRTLERQPEEPFDRAWFEKNGFKIADWPTDVAFEGAGDALIDRGSGAIWMGHGFRTDEQAAPLIGKIYGRKMLPLRLVDPRFYHLDTCLCPLRGGFLLYFPPAFDDAAQKTIADNVPAEKRIAISEEDAVRFACNAVDVDGHIVLNDASPALQNRLRAAGFTPVLVPLGEFLKAGGTAKCLTLKLVEK